jgi:putative ABC transport system ATP-binding protein
VTSSAPPVLLAEGVRKVYRTGAQEVQALRAVHLAIDRGELVAVMARRARARRRS